VLSFFPLFDTQRAMLSNAYNEFATFSFQANTSIPARAKIQGFQYSKEMPNQRHLEWSPWLGAGSRNLSRVAGAVDKVLKSIHVGRENTLSAMSSLPQTKHDIVGAAEKFCIDAWPVTHEDQTTLFLSIHGQLIEGLSQQPKIYIPAKLRIRVTVPVGGVRSFDRSFILVPAPEGSRCVQIFVSRRMLIAANQGESEWVGRRNTVRSTCDPCLFQPRSMESWTSSCTGSTI
jgi:nuclear RNA export factor